MKYRILNVFISVFLIALFVFSSTTISFAAQEEQIIPQSLEKEIIQSNIGNIPDANESIQEIELIPTGDVVQIDDNFQNIRYIGETSPYAIGELQYAMGTVVDTIEANDSLDVICFNVSEKRYFQMNFRANSLDYRVYIGKLNFDTMEITTMTGALTPGSVISTQLPTLAPNECYTFLVTSIAEFEQMYQIDYNFTTPVSYGTKIGCSGINSTYMTVVNYETGNIYVDGQLKLTMSNNNPLFEYSDDYSFYWPGGYKKCSVSITDTILAPISTTDSGNLAGNVVGPYNYSSQGIYSSPSVSSAVIFIPVYRNSLIKVFRSIYQSGVNTVYDSTFEDHLGKRTPRRLDASDIPNYSNHYLVYDLKTDKVIDWYSVYNGIYIYGYEEEPLIDNNVT